ncbi:MAG TPA: HDIG domain-containing protein [Methanoregulaceae archaeon]|nr:HDIG domain-containing protein [Methanoregulaceae archaeon]MDD5684269.1 HDIG domain-containing protein [Methanoregulaceae archaeon]HOP67095.1 HDIG domain-containing protein [Methanoregulaceae archaeon]HPJ74272.1 HDIG domain-containing protein [Methanoregulaceae archaeon]HPQ75933.1 HDIG domain-containing protein [Methanoregulaceae archaeon]
MEKTETARQLLEQYVSGESLIRHCLACGAIMKKAAGTLGEDEERFETIGILHDIDFEVVDGDMERPRNRRRTNPSREWVRKRRHGGSEKA